MITMFTALALKQYKNFCSCECKARTPTTLRSYATATLLWRFLRNLQMFGVTCLLTSYEYKIIL